MKSAISHEEIKSLLDRADEAEKQHNFVEVEQLASEAIHKLGSLVPNEQGTILSARATLLLGVAATSQRDFSLARERLDAARVLSESVADKAGIARAMGEIAIVYHHLLDIPHALSYLNKSLAILEELGDWYAVAAKLYNIGNIHSELGNCANAMDFYTRALAINEEIGNKEGAATIVEGITNYLAQISDFALALDYLARELVLREGLGDKAGVAKVLSRTGRLHYYLGDTRLAMEHYERSRALHEEIGDNRFSGENLVFIGEIFMRFSDYPRAMDYFSRSVEIFENLDDKRGLVPGLNWIGESLVSIGEHQKALDYFERGLKAAEESGDKYFIIKSLECYGKNLITLSNYQRAMDCFERSHTIHQEMYNKDFAECLANIGLIYSKSEFEGYDPVKAEEYLLRAIVNSEENGSKVDQCNAEEFLAELYEKQERWQEYAVHFKRYHDLKAKVLSDEARKAAEQMEVRRVIAEKDRLREIEKLKLEQDMKHQQEILTNKALQLVQQTEMIQNFRTEMEGVVHHADNAEIAIHLVQKKLKELPENVLNWERFEKDFRTVHPHFQETLKERVPTLTKMELKICCLVRIGMKSHEIATLLFLSERTVESHRYRMRKKLTPAKGQEMIDVLMKL